MMLSAFAAPVLRPSLSPDEVVRYATPSGWEAPLRRYRPRSPSSRPPVVLVHGLGVNHLNWDFRREVSLAVALQEAGWDVWVVVLPGDEGTSGGQPVSFESLVDDALPAALEVVLRETGHEGVVCVGHSMGAMLLYASLAEQPIVAGVGVSGAGQFDHVTAVVRAGRRVRRGRGRVTTRGWAWTLPANPALSLVANRRNLDGPTIRGLARHALDDAPRAVREQLVRYTHIGELVREDGRALVDFDVGTPLLLLGGTRDRLVHVRDVATTARRFPNAGFVELEGYGHIDPLLGVGASDEVYPLVLKWLDETVPRTGDGG